MAEPSLPSWRVEVTVTIKYDSGIGRKLDLIRGNYCNTLLNNKMDMSWAMRLSENQNRSLQGHTTPKFCVDTNSISIATVI